MSAYVVERNHIRFLVAAAERLAKSKFSYWYPARKATGRMYLGEDIDLDEIGQILWDENIRSVTGRYPDTVGQDGTIDYDNLPGPCNEVFLYQHPKELGWHNMRPVDVFKACDCYEYQSCEHDEWEASEAFCIIQSIKDCAMSASPGYSEAAWGAPEPDSGAVSILSLCK